MKRLSLRGLRQFFKFMAVSIVAFFLLVVAALVSVIEHPQWILTSKNLQRVADKLRAQDIEISWKDFQVHAGAPHFLRPEIALNWTDLKVRKSGSEKSLNTELKMQGDFPSVGFEAEINFRRFPPRLEKLGPIQISARQLTIEPATQRAPKPESSPTSLQIPSFLQHTQIEPIHVAVDHWEIVDPSLKPEGEAEGSILLKYEKGKDQTLSHSLEGEIVARGRVTAHMHLSAQVKSIENGAPKGRSKRRAAEPSTDLQAVLTGTIDHIAPQIRTIQLNDCHLHVVLGEKNQGELQTNCPLGITAETIQFKQFPQVTFENKIGAKLSGDFRTDDYNDMKKPVHTQAQLELTPFYPLGEARKSFRSWGSFAVEGDAVPAKPPQEWKIHSKIDLELAIEEFHDLVKILDKTPLSVPAPFHVLRGDIHLIAKGDVAPGGGEIPVEFHTNLQFPSTRSASHAQAVKSRRAKSQPAKSQPAKSQEEKLVFDSQGTLKFKKELAQAAGSAGHQIGYDLNLQLEAVLTDVQLALPHFDLSSFPKVVPDSRIRSELEKRNKAGPGRFNYQVHVVTREKPVRIVTNLASAPVPVRTDLRLDSKSPPLGKIDIEEFPVDVFNRKATIEKFDLTLERNKMPISGLVKVEYVDYTVNIALKGTIDDPIYQFTSEPALSEQDVISVLLFGKTSDDLDSDQSDSVGSVRGAAADKSLNLASLYLLAATPIESVGYDPASGAVTAKVKIASGTSLNVAGGGPGNEGLQTVGIRKRLGSNFSITTEVTSSELDQSGSLAGSATENNQRTVSALLEWRHRY